MKRWILGLAVLGLLLSQETCVRAVDNLVLNGGFETGDFSDWNVGYMYYDFHIVTGIPEFVHSGEYAAQLAGFEQDTFLSQDIVTTPGATYHVSYWLKGDGNTPNNVAVSFGETSLFYEANMGAFPYAEYNFDVEATTEISTLQFGIQNDQGYFRLDDVAVTLVPEPSTLALLVASCVGLLGYAWRRRQRTE